MQRRKYTILNVSILNDLQNQDLNLGSDLDLYLDDVDLDDLLLDAGSGDESVA